MLGDIDEVRAALAEDPTRARMGGAHGISILFHAALSGRRDLCELLLGAGADTREGDGQQPALHGAVYADAPDVAVLLLAAGADPAARDFGNRTAEELARAMGRTAVAEVVRVDGA
jgi:ankyrin repeat protein